MPLLDPRMMLPNTGLLGPTPASPSLGGLLSPVIWDRLQRGINPMMTTEGARPMYSGGGGSFYQGGTEGRLTDQYPLDLRGGRGNPPPQPPWKPDWQRSYADSPTISATTPSGVRVVVSTEYGDAADVMFYDPRSGLQMPSEGSTKQSINRFSDVFTAVKDYVKNFGADRLTFSAATNSHVKLYDRVAPMMAKELGGELHIPSKGIYQIDISRPK